MGDALEHQPDRPRESASGARETGHLSMTIFSPESREPSLSAAFTSTSARLHLLRVDVDAAARRSSTSQRTSAATAPATGAGRATGQSLRTCRAYCEFSVDGAGRSACAVGDLEGDFTEVVTVS